MKNYEAMWAVSTENISAEHSQKALACPLAGPGANVNARRFSPRLKRGVLRVAVLLLCIGYLQCAQISVHAQTGFGAVVGLVRDTSGAAIQSAKVTITSVSTGIVTEAQTNSDGAYSLSGLTPGAYTMAIEAKSFRRESIPDVEVLATQTATIDITLKPGTASESITVTANGSRLTPETQVFTTNISDKIATTLPYPEVSTLGAALLAPGVTGDIFSPGGVSTENPGVYGGNIVPGATMSVGGGGPGKAAFIIDGSDVTQASYPRAGISISGDSLATMSVISTGMPAQYGRTASGVIVQTTKLGGSQLHGTVSYRHTDPSLQAYPYGQTIGAALHQNFFSGTLTGPVYIPHIYDGRKRTFFFVSVEPARLSNVIQGQATEPTADELAGNFANSYTLIDQTVLKNSGAAAALAAPRTGHLWYQFATNGNGFPYGPVISNKNNYVQIPNDSVASQLANNPFAQFVLKQFPTPANPGPHWHFLRPDGLWLNNGYNVMYDRGVKNVDNRYSFRVDQVFSDRDRMFFRYTYIPVVSDRFEGFLPTLPVDPLFSDAAWSRNFTVNETHVINSSTVNELRLMYMRDRQYRDEVGAGESDDWAAKYGLTPATSGKGMPGLSFGYTLNAGIYSGIGAQVDESFQIGDDLSISIGRHMLKIGVDLRKILSSQKEFNGVHGGNYTFSASNTNNGTTGGNGLASFILGEINGFSNTPVPAPGYYRWNYIAGYAQDDYRALPNLTINLGVRYEVETPRMEKYDNQGTFIPGLTGTLNGTNAIGAYCFSEACGLKKTLWPTNYFGFEPRMGISWATSRRSTVHASYGIMRVPLTGYGSTPDPDFNVASFSVGGTNGGTVANQLVDYITNPVGSLTSFLSGVSGKGPFFSLNGIQVPYIDQSSAVPYTQQWMLGVQYAISPNTFVQAAYAGLKSTHLISNLSNSPLQYNLPSESTLLGLIANHTNLGATKGPNPYGVTQKGSVLNETYLQASAPYQNFFNQYMQAEFLRVGSATYNALYLTGSHTNRYGVTLNASFTWSKSMDNTGGDNNTNNFASQVAKPQNPWDQRGEKAVSAWDIPAKLTTGYNYELKESVVQPLVSKAPILKKVIGGWNTSGMFNAQSGTPFMVTLGSGGYWLSTGGGSVFPTSISNYIRPDIVPGQPCINPNWRSNPSVNAYFNVNRYSVPGSLNNPAFGNAPRSMSGCRDPRLITFDAAVSKDIRFGTDGRRMISLRLNAMNALNHPVFFMSGNLAATHNAFGAFNTASITNPAVAPFTQNATFGTLSIANTAGFSRVVQLNARFVW